jgi:hypothetical protein
VPGAKADLEVIARAALAFASAVREVTYIIDPSIELRIELVSGTESSLSLNSLLKSRIVDKLTTISLSAVAFGCFTWFTQHTLDFAYEHLLAHLMSQTESASVPPEQIESIVRKTLETFQREGSKQTGRLFMELDADSAIAGVGVTQHPGTRPDRIIPKSEFRSRAIGSYGIDEATLYQGGRRVRTNVEILTLVSPVLVEGTRKWKFVGTEGEFGATIKDGLFVDDVLRGRSAIPMAAGVRLEVELQTIEEPVLGGAWVVRQRNILRVRRVIPPVLQTQMDSLTQAPHQPPGSEPENKK